ncbi:MAG: dTDP-4-dehydrorhamnose 3,5-epimerase [Pseudomonadota bacterium]
MKLSETFIEDLFVVETAPCADHRGSFSRFFCKRELLPVLGERDIVQINYSITGTIGSIRGLHYQKPPFAEMKLVRCLKGKVWDVAVDLRAGSPTFLKYFGQELTPKNGRMIVIPEGFAHGFQTLDEDCELLYLHTEFYMPEAQAGLAWNDPTLAIPWPLPVSEISGRDCAHPSIPGDFSGIVL